MCITYSIKALNAKAKAIMHTHTSKDTSKDKGDVIVTCDLIGSDGKQGDTTALHNS